MRREWTRRAVGVGAAMAVVLSVSALGVPASSAADDATIYFIQGLPGKTINIAVDGKTVVRSRSRVRSPARFRRRAASGESRCPSGSDTIVDQMFSVKAGSSWDVVVHLPVRPRTKPVVTVFRNDLTAVPKGKASLVVAHTAAVPPADIRVDGKVLFENIANGESLQADRAGGDVRGGDRADRRDEAGHPRPGGADRQGRRGQPGLRGGRPREEDDERRRARASRPGPAGPASRPRSTPGPVVRRPGRARR